MRRRSSTRPKRCPMVRKRSSSSRSHCAAAYSVITLGGCPATVTTCGVVARSRGGPRETAPARSKSRYTPAAQRNPQVRQQSPAGVLDALVRALLAETEFAPPYEVFGHSLGALVAYEVTRELAARGLALPERLVVSAFPAPHLPRHEAP